MRGDDGFLIASEIPAPFERLRAADVLGPVGDGCFEVPDMVAQVLKLLCQFILLPALPGVLLLGFECGEFVDQILETCSIRLELSLKLSAGVGTAKQVDGFAVGHAREGRGHFLQQRGITFQQLEIRTMVLQHRLHHVADELLRELHQIGKLGEGDFGFNHPELGEMPPRFRFLGAEGRAETVDFAERHAGAFQVELAGLGEEDFFAEVVDAEKCACAFRGAGREDGSIDEREAVSIKEVPRGADQCVPYAENRGLAWGAKPEMTVLHEEVHAVRLARDGVIGHILQHVQG